MSHSIARQVAAAGTAILAATLLLVGIATAFALHGSQRITLDEALLIAAHGGAHPEVDDDVEVEHSRAPIEVWIVGHGDKRIPAALIQAALRQKGPFYETVGDERIVLLPFEVGDDDEDEHDGRLNLAAAAAPKVTYRRSMGPFALVYSLFAIFAALLATFVQLRMVRRAFTPIERAREQASRVAGFGDDQRLDVDSPAEIQPLLVAINDLLDRLDRSYQVQARFSAEAAHELRTPVTSMLGEIDVALRNTRSPEDYQALLTSIREEVLRLRQLVDGLTALTRVDAGDLGRTREPMRAGEIAANALRAESATLKAAGNTVDFELDDDPEIEVHRSLVEAALGNLLRNAARHAPGSEVKLQVVQKGEYVEFLVDDAGPGVGENDREVLFDRFVRTKEARDVDRQGLGLGLSITREVARRHGGDCTLEESPFGGLRARLSLRISSSHTQQVQV
jgi:signal transduction histidine kinase